MTSYADEKRVKLEKRRELINKIMFIPIVLLLGIIPLLVRVEEVLPKDMNMYMIFGTTELVDYFSQLKSVGIITLTIIMIVLLYFFIEKSEMKKDLYSKIYLTSSVVLVGMTLISTLLAEYKEIAMWGVYDRAEGCVIWTCYIIMMLYTYYVVKNEKGYKWIISPLIFLVGVITVLGIFQYIGKDLLTQTKLGLSLIVPKEYDLKGPLVMANGNANKVVGTFYHYNYVGSFGAMMVPLFVTLTLLVKGRLKKAVLGVVSIASLFVLFGSSARSGIVGLALAVVVGIIVFARKILKAWKKVLPIVIAFVMVIVGFDAVTGGKIFARIPTLLEDAIALVKPVDKEFDYKDYIPVREIINEKGKITFVLQEHQFNIEYKDGQLQFKDEVGNPIEYTSATNYGMITENGVSGEEQYIIKDDRFSNIKIFREDIGVLTEQNKIDAILVQIEGGSFAFKLDETTGLTQINDVSGLPWPEAEAESIGFRGKEKLGSARGYIWSRSLPVLLKDNLIIGNGPDTFPAYFPQNDRLAKWWAYGTTNMNVDKAHSLYLQIGMNQGGIALTAFLVMVITYIIHSFKLYSFKDEYDGTDAMGIGVFLAIVGYLGAGIFNDSIISVAPIFWILLGTGFAVNYMKQQINQKLEKEAPHRVIKMK